MCALPLLAQNVVQIENMRAGSPDWVRINPASNHEIEGYASATSVNRGQQINLYVSTSDPTYTINIYRTGWYGGAGARKVLGPIARTGILQPNPAPDPATGLIECNWSDPYEVTTSNPQDTNDWPSGVYVAKLTAGISGKESYIVFVVRDDTRLSTHYFQTSVTTYQAYNEWGGKSLYAFNSTSNIPARKVSFNRPYLHGGGTGEYLFRWEYNMVRFLEREGYDVSYCTDIDTHRRGSLIQQHRDFLVVGHDEYWSDEMRTSVTAARDSGVNLGFFSANDCYWQIRLEPSTLDAGQIDRTIVAYKEAYTSDPYYSDRNPGNDHLVTNAWRLTPVDNSEDALIGVMYIADPVNADLVIDDVTSMPWVFENTGLVSGSALHGLLGYEVDKIQPRSPLPITRLGHSPFTTNKTDGKPNLSDYSDMTMYAAPGGALVFATGSIQFALGLDSWNAAANGGDLTSPAAQQMTRNILKRFAGTSSSLDCQYALSPSSSSVASTTGSSSFNVTTFCAWTATADVSWIRLTSPSSGTGSATIAFTWEANTTSAPRTGHVQVGDRVYALTQARPCAYAASPDSFQFGPNGGSGSISITTDSTCFWSSSVSSSYPWITITNGASGQGTGTTMFSVAPNTSAQSRSGLLVAAGVGVVITQQGRLPVIAASDLNGDGRSDIVLQSQGTGDVAVWLMNGVDIASGRRAGNPGGYVVRLTGDYDGDGRADLLMQSSSFDVAIWLMNGSAVMSGALIGNPGNAWKAVGSGDIDGDGRADLVLQNQNSGDVAVWLLQGGTIKAGSILGNPGPGYTVVGLGDFNGDGKADILLQNASTGDLAEWQMSGSGIAAGAVIGGSGAAWKVAGVGDTDGDGKADIILQNQSSGHIAIWFMNHFTIMRGAVVASSGMDFHALGSADYDGDGRSDILFRNPSTGEIAIWLLNGSLITRGAVVGAPGTDFVPVVD